jgi:hypothetical protein
MSGNAIRRASGLREHRLHRHRSDVTGTARQHRDAELDDGTFCCRFLVRHRDEAGNELLDLPGLPLPDPGVPAPVRFIPVWDASLLVHARRTGILPEQFRPLIFNTKTPHSVDTFLVDGRVAGTWRYEDGRITLKPFEELPRRVMGEVRDEADRMEAWFTSG